MKSNTGKTASGFHAPGQKKPEDGERYMMFEQYMKEYVQEHADEIREEAREEGLAEGRGERS